MLAITVIVLISSIPLPVIAMEDSSVTKKAPGEEGVRDKQAQKAEELGRKVRTRAADALQEGKKAIKHTVEEVKKKGHTVVEKSKEVAEKAGQKATEAGKKVSEPVKKVFKKGEKAVKGLKDKAKEVAKKIKGSTKQKPSTDVDEKAP